MKNDERAPQLGGLAAQAFHEEKCVKPPLLEAFELAQAKGSLAWMLGNSSLEDFGSALSGFLQMPGAQLNGGIDSLSSCSTLVLQACVSGLTEELRLLLAAGASAIDAAANGTAPIHAAMGRAGLPLVDLLLAHGAQLGSADGNGNAPLALAACHGRADLCWGLLERGADLGLANLRGRSARDMAQEVGALKALAAIDAWVEARQLSEHAAPALRARAARI